MSGGEEMGRKVTRRSLYRLSVCVRKVAEVGIVSLGRIRTCSDTVISERHLMLVLGQIRTCSNTVISGDHFLNCFLKSLVLCYKAMF